MSHQYKGPPSWPDTRRKTNQWGVSDDGLVHFHDLDFDLEGYFDRYETEQLSEDEKAEFSARVYGLFCRDFFKSGGHPAAIEPWVASYVAKKLFQGLGGVPWNDLMGMPWDEPTPMMTKRGERAFSIYAGIRNSLHAYPDAKVSDLLREAAQAHCVSYETDRRDYYAMKH